MRTIAHNDWKSKYELAGSHSMARNGDHGGIRLDGGVSPNLETERGILAISSEQYSVGDLGSSRSSVRRHTASGLSGRLESPRGY
jgi:hypothetical protein